MSEKTNLPAVSETDRGKGLILNVGGIPIPLRRTFSALDRLIAIPLEALGDVLEKKMKASVESHVEAVQSRRAKKGKKIKIDNPSVKTAKTIADWAIGAGVVEEGDKELSALWRSILDKIMEDEDDGEDLLRIVQSLSNADLRYFLRRYAGATGFWTTRPEGALTRLHSAGLISRPLSVAYIATVTAIGLIGFGFLRAFYPVISTPFIAVSGTISGLIGIISLGFLGIGVVLLVRYVPTETGNRLRDLYREYLKRD